MLLTWTACGTPASWAADRVRCTDFTFTSNASVTPSGVRGSWRPIAQCTTASIPSAAVRRAAWSVALANTCPSARTAASAPRRGPQVERVDLVPFPQER